MRKYIVYILFISIVINVKFTSAQSPNDSIIRFSELQFHSDFEKKSLTNYIGLKKDTLNLFLSIDKTINEEEATQYKNHFYSALEELKRTSPNTRRLNSRIKDSYGFIHNEFLRKYKNNDILPSIFRFGIYNCVTASMLYALAFEKQKIPYKVMVSSDHVYLVANPGANSVVIETTNPSFEKTVFNGEFQRQYVSYLKSSKQISEVEFNKKSTEEIFEEYQNRVKQADFDNLASFQYYNVAISLLENNNTLEALKYCQKAYFFYPREQVKILLYNTLLIYLEKCNFSNISDMDYIAQLSRFENIDSHAISGIFHNVIVHFSQFTDKQEYCDSLHNRLISQISNKNLKDDISFDYNLQMALIYANSSKLEKYILNAVKIKNNNRNANQLFQVFLRTKINTLKTSKQKLDYISNISSSFPTGDLNIVIQEFKSIIFLDHAKKCFLENQSSMGDYYLSEFEKSCNPPITSFEIQKAVEIAYTAGANFYYFKNQTAKANAIKSRGLLYVPESPILGIRRRIY